MVKQIPRYVCSFWHDPPTWQTDRRKNRQTPQHSIDRACIVSRGKNASQHEPVYLQQFPSYSNHNCKKSPFLCTPAFIFCLPWGCPCGNHAKRCMNVKTIQCLPNPSQHVPIYLQQFPSYSNGKCKNRRFHVPQPTFLFLLETPLRLSRNMLHGWKDNSMLAKPLAACTYLSSMVSELYDA